MPWPPWSHPTPQLSELVPSALATAALLAEDQPPRSQVNGILDGGQEQATAQASFEDWQTAQPRLHPAARWEAAQHQKRLAEMRERARALAAATIIRPLTDAEVEAMSEDERLAAAIAASMCECQQATAPPAQAAPDVAATVAEAAVHECCVCMEEPCAVRYACGHNVCCESCTDKLLAQAGTARCPACRASIVVTGRGEHLHNAATFVQQQADTTSSRTERTPQAATPFESQRAPMPRTDGLATRFVAIEKPSVFARTGITVQDRMYRGYPVAVITRVERSGCAYSCVHEGEMILRINGVDMRRTGHEHVSQVLRRCNGIIELEVAR